jgi:3-deoxy-manno-octulosonate cytidylyltransferase (CMP-KDO synthetase)
VADGAEEKAKTMNPIVLIPARLASTRLPDKPLADIAGQTMIERVWRQAVKAALGPVLVAAAEQEIVDVIARAGGNALLTEPALPSGTDRIFAALEKADPDAGYDVVVNLQGDLPALDPAAIRAAAATLETTGTDIATLVAEIDDPADYDNPSFVKAIVAWEKGERRGRALYFTRARAPTGEGPLFVHIGIYAFRRAALARMVKLAPSPLETREKLEQLRALEAGMTIGVARVDAVPLSVDTPADLEKARAVLARA